MYKTFEETSSQYLYRYYLFFCVCQVRPKCGMGPYGMIRLPTKDLTKNLFRRGFPTFCFLFFRFPVFPFLFPLFTALHEMQTRSSDEDSVCLSVYQTLDCDKTEERSVQIFYTVPKII